MAAAEYTGPPEQWKPILGYEELYEVSDLGRVRRLPRVQVMKGRWGPQMQRVVAGMMLSPTLTGRYLCVNLNKGGKGRMTRVNILVCSHFNGPKPSADACALHNNGDRFDNRAVNLRWGDHLENARDRELHGMTVKGERQHSARFTADQVRAIRHRVSNGEHMASIAQEFGVNKSSVQSIVHRRSWAHI